MGLAERQRLLAGLATDAALRSRWHADPKSVEAEYGLEADERTEALTAFHRQIDGFARSLIYKRRQAAEALLPLSYQVLGAPQFAALFQQHASIHVPVGVKRHRDDALAFCVFLERSAASGLAVPTWAVDLIRFEAAGLMATESTRRWLVRAFRFHVEDLIELALGRESRAPSLRPTLVLWCRWGAKGRLRRFVLHFLPARSRSERRSSASTHSFRSPAAGASE